jgi:hypothetical protein
MFPIKTSTYKKWTLTQKSKENILFKQNEDTTVSKLRLMLHYPFHNIFLTHLVMIAL